MPLLGPEGGYVRVGSYESDEDRRRRQEEERQRLIDEQRRQFQARAEEMRQQREMARAA